MGVNASPLRLRRVLFKDGRTIEVLHRKDHGVDKILPRTVDRAFETGTEMAAFALVCWDANGEIFVNYHNGPRSPVPGGGIARYAHDALLAETAVRWSKD